jgi:hypothetical protein
MHLPAAPPLMETIAPRLAFCSSSFAVCLHPGKEEPKKYANFMQIALPVSFHQLKMAPRIFRNPGEPGLSCWMGRIPAK